jgi:hypothetical protein
MKSEWEYVDIASCKSLQSITSIVAAFTFTSYSDAEFYVEVDGVAADPAKLKKNQVERGGKVYEVLNQNLFSFAFSVQRTFETVVTAPQKVAYIPSNEKIDELLPNSPLYLEEEIPSTIATPSFISLWTRPGYLRTEVESIPLAIAKELSRPFWFHLYHRICRRKVRSYIFLVNAMAQMLR